jgi:hypothetical protein
VARDDQVDVAQVEARERARQEGEQVRVPVAAAVEAVEPGGTHVSPRQGW